VTLTDPAPDRDSAPGLRALERARTYSARSPFIAGLGLTITEAGNGWLQSRMAPGPEHRQSQGYVHGAILTAALDHTAGMATLIVLAPGMGVVTTHIDAHFLAPAIAPELACRAEVLRSGGRYCVTQATLSTETGEWSQPLAIPTVTLAPIPDPAIHAGTSGLDHSNDR
jgi:uncharacterized protein (TIGR00369 family)